MSAPSSAHHALRQAAWRRTWDRLLRAPYGLIITTDTAASSRPLPAGAQAGQHEADASRRPNQRAGFEEVNRRDELTTIDA